MSPLSEKKPVKAIEDLRQLHKSSISGELSVYLSSFSTEKEHSLSVFAAGVQAFMGIANLSPEERISFYGNKFYGLHYNNDLAKLYNEDKVEEHIEAYKLNFIRPIDEWDYQSKDGFSSLIYKGIDLAGALDKLLQGPTVIDCGMFCQLSIWFGVRYILGNEQFNEIFGKMPFYLTQLVYNPITDAAEPFKGNPLYSFFEQSLAESLSGVAISHVHNHSSYQIKHPGGNYGGENCIVINGRYTIFDATLDKKSELSRKDVERLLLEAFNAPQNVNDHTKLAVYRETPEDIHTKFGFSYGQLIHLAEALSRCTIDEDTFSIDVSAKPVCQLQFNFERFRLWIAHIRNNRIDDIDYVPVAVNAAAIHALVEQIPYENKEHMSFATFKRESPLHQEIFALSKRFCCDVMRNQSVFVVLTGQAGIGKTASAVSCAKELVTRGKRVMWISEVTVRGWTEQADSMEALSRCGSEIKELLAENPDAVFLDDDNLVGYAGQLLLEEIYQWYAKNPGKGLFITSNEPITLKNCYGPQLDKTYHFPPFSGYSSPQFQNTYIRKGLYGRPMRPEHVMSICDLTESERMRALLNYSQEASVGIVVSHDAYEIEKARLGDVEFVPGFPEGTFTPMTEQSMKDNTFGPAYHALTAEQKKYIKTFPVSKKIQDEGEIINTGIFSYTGIYVRIFDKTPHQMIAVELLQETHWSKKEIIDRNSIQQLLSVVNYAHDKGGKKILLVNHTRFSESELFVKIEEGIPENEKERTMARIKGLLFSPELAREASVLSSDMKTHKSGCTDELFKPTCQASQITLGFAKRTSSTASTASTASLESENLRGMEYCVIL